MRKLLIVVMAGLVLGACSGASNVVTVDGVAFDVDDMPLETEASTLDMDLFREAINWVVADRILVQAAEDDFGLVLSNQDVDDAASTLLGSTNPADPTSNLAYQRIQARIGPSGLLGPAILAALPDGVQLFDWAGEKFNAADVRVNPRYGEWRLAPNPGVYER
ncbi:MAG: hypothetical protein HKN80_00165 [Acidimicrobiia bacterium]|nr:hypothetical protein [Acidimicrobiia bacterium]